ncbi:hypothetical protein Sango_1250900 [Sesamum angolense]|uniref:Uncharacterized protein n=1 Tax=Sesamum angolense TaxID=2727404 RepID=A0AAE1WR33_9LAMI|nr:hypothetical protein Sango_1250900 [Sesamum angolense]
MFLMMVILDRSNPKRLVDLYLEPLIEELQNLWHVGVLTHDNTTNRAIMMCVELMWIVNGLPAYGMASGWSTASVMGVKFGKMKDNLNARKNLKIICNRLELEVDERRPNVMPKAVCTRHVHYEKVDHLSLFIGLRSKDGGASFVLRGVQLLLQKVIMMFTGSNGVSPSSNCQ